MVRYYGTHRDLGTGRLTITRNSLSLEEKGLFREQIAGTIMLMQLHNGHHLNPQSMPPVFEEGSIIPPITRATEMIIYLAGGVSKPASTQESRQAITLYYRKPNRLAQNPESISRNNQYQTRRSLRNPRPSLFRSRFLGITHALPYVTS